MLSVLKQGSAAAKKGAAKRRKVATVPRQSMTLSYFTEIRNRPVIFMRLRFI